MKYTTYALLFFLCIGLLVRPVEAAGGGAPVLPKTWRDYKNMITLISCCGCIGMVGTYRYLKSKAARIQRDSLARADVAEIADIIQNPEKYADIGVKLPRGILLVGPPGEARNSVARAIAGEQCFLATSGTIYGIFSTDHYHWGAEFSRAYENAHELTTARGKPSKSIIFIDELDGISDFWLHEHGYRGSRAALIKQIDSIPDDRRVLLIAATTRVEDLDPSLTRPGRFDHIIDIGNPDEKSRMSILSLYARNIKHGPLDFAMLASKTIGKNATDLKNLVNKAALWAVREGAPVVTQEHFERALSSLSK